MAELTLRKYNPGWGTHIPVVVKALQASKGPVLELGTGAFSTPLLHMLCLDQERELISYEDVPDFVTAHKHFVTDKHKIHLVDDWDKVDLQERRWSVALIDHPEDRRLPEALKLVDNTDYVIIHDSNGRWEKYYHYSQLYPHFKYRYIYDKTSPHTTVLSNFIDLSKFSV